MSSIDLYLMVFFIVIGLVILKKDAVRYASQEHCHYIANTDNSCVYTVCDKINNRKSKLLLILYSLHCTRCDSSHVFVELSQEDPSLLILTCRECNHRSYIKLSDCVTEKEDTQD